MKKKHKPFAICKSGNISRNRPVRESAVASGRFSSAIILHILTSAIVTCRLKLSSRLVGFALLKKAFTVPDVDTGSAMLL